MDILKVYDEFIKNKTAQSELKKNLKQAAEFLGKSAEYLKNIKQEDVDKVMNVIAKKLPDAAVKAYDEGKISDEAVEQARKLTVISPGELSDSIYNMSKKILEFAKSEKNRRGQ